MNDSTSMNYHLIQVIFQRSPSEQWQFFRNRRGQPLYLCRVSSWDGARPSGDPQMGFLLLLRRGSQMTFKVILRTGDGPWRRTILAKICRFGLSGWQLKMTYRSPPEYSWIGRGLHAHVKLIPQATVKAILEFNIPTKSSRRAASNAVVHNFFLL